MSRKQKLIDNLSYLENDVYNKSEVTSRDYKPYYQYKIGFLDEQFFPVYGYLNFGYLPHSSKYFLFKDTKGREVILYKGSQGKPETDSFFRAYRYDKNGDFIYDNSPLSTPFMSSNQRINYIDCCSTNYIVAQIKTLGDPNTYNYYLIRTNSSYDTSVWQNVLDITSSMGFSASVANNITIDEKEQKLYVIASENASGGLTSFGTIKLKIYNLNNGNYINEYSIFDMPTDLNYSAYSTSTKALSYGGLRTVFNYNTGDLLVSLKTIIYYDINGGRTYITKDINLSLNLSDTLRQTGTGTYSYYIPINSTNYDFFNNGIGIGSWNSGGRHDAYSFNEYDNSIYYIDRSTWIDTGFNLRQRDFSSPLTSSGYFLDSLPEIYSTQRHNVPDSSPWSKTCYKKCIITDDYYIGYGNSTKYGVTYFISKYNINGQDIEFIAGQWRILDDINLNSNINLKELDRWFITKNGTTVEYYIYDNSFNVFKIDIDSNFNIIYTDMGLQLPTPSSSSYGRQNQWAIDFSNNKVYWVVLDYTDSHKAKIIWTNNNGSSWDLGPVLNSTQASGSASQFSDGNARAYGSNGSNMFMENNLVYVNFTYLSVGGAYGTPYEQYDSATNTLTTFSNSTNPYNGGNSIGYNSRMSYYISDTNIGYYSMRFYSQSVLSNLLNGNSLSTLYTNVSTSSGLGATLLNFPVFLDGYYYQTATTDVALEANADNFVYLETVDNTTLNAYSSVTDLNNTSNRIKIAKITTDSANPISQELYDLSFNDTTAPKYIFKKIKLENVSLSQGQSITVLSSDYGLNDYDRYRVMDFRSDGTGDYFLNSNVEYSLSFDKSQIVITSQESGTQTYTFLIHVYLGI